jgi:hypothetical protein
MNRANYIISRTVSDENKFQWQFPLAVQLIPAGLLAIVMFVVPGTNSASISRLVTLNYESVETPRFLITKKVGLPMLHQFIEKLL